MFGRLYTDFAGEERGKQGVAEGGKRVGCPEVCDYLRNINPKDDVLVLRGVHVPAQFLGGLPKRVLEPEVCAAVERISSVFPFPWHGATGRIF